MSGSENTWRNKDLESITKEITDTTQLNKNTIKRHISKFWNPKELSPSKRHCYVPLDCSVRHIVSFSTSPRGSHACSNWAFACSASLLPPLPSEPQILWFGTSSVLWWNVMLITKSKSHANGVTGPHENGRVDSSPCSKFQGQRFSPGGACGQHVPSGYLLPVACLACVSQKALI